MATRSGIRKSAPAAVQEPSQGRDKKSLMERFGPVLIVLLVVMAFGLGSLWSKVKYLESGSGNNSGTGAAAAAANPQAPASKYQKFSDALKAFSTAAGLDANKLISCVNSGDKANTVSAQYQQGIKLGVQGTPGFFVNGKFLGGAFPISSFKELIDRELDGTGSTDYKDYKEANLAQAGAMPQDPAFVAKPVSVDTSGAIVRGPANAKVTIVEFSDFQCPYCAQGHQTVSQLMQTYGDKINFVYLDFPLTQIHPLAQKSAEAWECAKDQGADKAWSLHDLMFANQADWANSTL